MPGCRHGAVKHMLRQNPEMRGGIEIRMTPWILVLSEKACILLRF